MEKEIIPFPIRYLEKLSLIEGSFFMRGNVHHAHPPGPALRTRVLIFPNNFIKFNKNKFPHIQSVLNIKPLAFGIVLVYLLETFSIRVTHLKDQGNV